MNKIMKYSIIALHLLSGCVSNIQERTEHPYKVYRLNTLEWIMVTEIDGCEYLIYSGPSRGGIIHKQNCKNHGK